MTDKQHLSKAKSMPIKFLKASGKGFFIEKDGYAIAIRDDLEEIIRNDAFKKHMKDILVHAANTSSSLTANRISPSL